MQPIGYGAKMAGLESKQKIPKKIDWTLSKAYNQTTGKGTGNTKTGNGKMIGENVKVYPRDHRKLVSGMIVGKNAEAYLIRTESGKYTTAKIATAIVVRKK
jgi:hypothetical protein